MAAQILCCRLRNGKALFGLGRFCPDIGNISLYHWILTLLGREARSGKLILKLEGRE